MHRVQKQEQKSPLAQQSREKSREKISEIASSLNCHEGKARCVAHGPQYNNLITVPGLVPSRPCRPLPRSHGSSFPNRVMTVPTPHQVARQSLTGQVSTVCSTPSIPTVVTAPT
eukprot:23804-Rhodomonas_salina.1